MDMNEFNNISSGQTRELQAQQNDLIHSLAENSETDINGDSVSERNSALLFADATIQPWTFYYAFVDQEECVRFFQTVGKIIPAVSANRYILIYLLNRYNLDLDEISQNRLADYAEHSRWRVNLIEDPEECRALMDSLHKRFSFTATGSSRELSKKDFSNILKALCSSLAEEYSFKPEGIRFTTYFHDLLQDFSLTKLREIALALNWDYKLYQGFRAKAFKHRAFNFLDRDEVSMYIALNYARECGFTAYKAFQALNRDYPDPKPLPKADSTLSDNTSKKKDPHRKEKNKILREAWQRDPGDTSANLMDSLFSQLENRTVDENTEDDRPNISLKPELLDFLFKKPIPFLTEIYGEIYRLNQEHPKRSWHASFLDKWEEFSDKVGIDMRDEGGHFDGEDEKPFGRHFTFRSLYGENVEKQIREKKEKNKGKEKKEGSGEGKETVWTSRISEIRDSDMILLAPDGVTDYYLDSQEFLNTRIRDRDFNPNTALDNEEHQRNLLLTVTFLNYAFDIDPESTSYEQRISDFEFQVIETMNECGFLSLYSGYAYDVFLKLLLSCTNPLDLFQYIWSRKTGSKINFF